jgi:integrase/recombinase XerC
MAIEAVHQFVDYLKFEKRYSQHTIVAYQDDLAAFFTFLKFQFETSDCAAVTSGFVRSWLAQMKEEGMSSKSLNRKISALKSFFKYCLRQQIIQQSPMTVIVSPKVSKRLPEFVQQDDMLALLNCEAFDEGFKGSTDQLLIRLLYATGMRRSEIANLKESQVNTHRKELRVLGKGNKERLIPMSADLLQAIAAYIAEKRKLFGQSLVEQLLVTVKGQALYPEYIYKTVKRYLSVATTLNKKSPHILRHSFATHLTNNGAELKAVKELLGHSSLAATQVYTHNTIEKLKQAFAKAHPKA